jgi:hypothetical protein
MLRIIFSLDLDRSATPCPPQVGMSPLRGITHLRRKLRLRAGTGLPVDECEKGYPPTCSLNKFFGRREPWRLRSEASFSAQGGVGGFCFGGFRPTEQLGITALAVGLHLNNMEFLTGFHGRKLSGKK